MWGLFGIDYVILSSTVLWLQLLRWIVSRLCNAKTASSSQASVCFLFCARLSDKTTVPHGSVEQCCRKEVAVCSAQRVLEGFDHSDVLSVPRTCCQSRCSTSGRAGATPMKKTQGSGAELRPCNLLSKNVTNSSKDSILKTIAS